MRFLLVAGLAVLVTVAAALAAGGAGSGEERYARALAAWRATGDPIDAPPSAGEDDEAAAPRFRAALREWQVAWRGLGQPLEEVDRSGFLDGDAFAALTRLRELVPSKHTGRSDSFGPLSRRWLDDLSRTTPLLATPLDPWVLPSPGSARHDRLVLDVGVRERLYRAILEADPTELARSMRADVWRASTVDKTLELRVRLARLRGDRETVAEVLERTLALDLEVHSDQTLWPLLQALQVAADREGLRALRTALEAWDLEPSTRATLLDLRRKHHGEWLRARARGRRPPTGLWGDCIDTRGPWERRRDRVVRPIEHWLWPEISASEHARYLEDAAALIEAFDARGLSHWPAAQRSATLAFLDDERLADEFLDALHSAWGLGTRRETNRRLALCSLAASLDGTPALTRALAAFPDPRSGRAFAVTRDEGGTALLTSPPTPSTFSPTAISWPLFLD